MRCCCVGVSSRNSARLLLLHPDLMTEFITHLLTAPTAPTAVIHIHLLNYFSGKNLFFGVPSLILSLRSTIKGLCTVTGMEPTIRPDHHRATQ